MFVGSRIEPVVREKLKIQESGNGGGGLAEDKMERDQGCILMGLSYKEDSHLFMSDRSEGGYSGRKEEDI